MDEKQTYHALDDFSINETLERLDRMSIMQKKIIVG